MEIITGTHQPLTPAEAKLLNSGSLHQSMILAVNYFLSDYYGRDLEIEVSKLVDKFLEFEPNYTRERIFQENLLNLEGIYEKFGWKVTFEKPSYFESGVSKFIFKAK